MSCKTPSTVYHNPMLIAGIILSDALGLERLGGLSSPTYLVYGAEGSIDLVRQPW